MHGSPRAIGRYAVLASLIVLGGLLGGCASRSVRSPVIDRVGIQVDLVRQVQGWTTQPRGYEHPSIISVQRLIHILNAVEVETRGKGEGFIREPAFHPDVVERTAQAMSEALSEASPDQEIAVQIVRKEMRFGVLHRKFLNSFLAYVDEGHLYLILRRVHWPIPDTAGSQKNEGLPKPRRDYSPMKFRVVAGEHLYYAAPQTLEIDWRNPVFQTAYRLPGSTQGEKRRREVIDRLPIPQAERNAASGAGNTISLDELSPDQLRALADLEEDRRQGRITESAYQRARRQLLRQR
jgi:hypothetical protein